ncbi:hypothetical protein EAH86_10595 [Pedococcus bigeumensis]|uniref:Uncharacterized protein n=1 Tax=Pedococcus bigeumensis TaxID=433644 RepID=A0A502CX30_9MICO|nr:hypothetical protein EAH86_10595 [Pedococcus bigeumensis]
MDGSAVDGRACPGEPVAARPRAPRAPRAPGEPRPVWRLGPWPQRTPSLVDVRGVQQSVRPLRQMREAPFISNLLGQTSPVDAQSPVKQKSNRG